MNRRLITPIAFANLVSDAQAQREDGFSTVQASVNAVLNAGYSEDWTPVLCGFINNSPLLAERWAAAVMQAALDRVELGLERN